MRGWSGRVAYLVVCEYHAQVAEPDGRVLLPAGSHIGAEAVNNPLLLTRRQPAHILWEVREQKVSSPVSNAPKPKARIDRTHPITPTTQVMKPSRMKIQRHASFPPTPSIFPIAVARSPPNAPPNAVDTKKKLKRFCDSERLYHMETAGLVERGERRRGVVTQVEATAGGGSVGGI